MAARKMRPGLPELQKMAVEAATEIAKTHPFYLDDLDGKGFAKAMNAILAGLIKAYATGYAAAAER